MSAHSTRPRHAFTLIELLIVIAIIALLIGLLMPAINSARKSAANARASSEIQQIGVAIQAFKVKTGADYIPDGGSGPNGTFQLRSVYYAAPAAGQVGTNSPEALYIARLWPHTIDPMTRNLVTGSTWEADLDANQTLTFFLTGSLATNYQGFSLNKKAPFSASTTGQTIGPFLEFDSTKFDSNGHYLDPWGTPYAYFTAVPSNRAASWTKTFTWTDQDGVARTVSPYEDADAPGRKMNEKSFQIISAGPNRSFGPGGSLWTPGRDFYLETQRDITPGHGIGGDDLANFKEGPLVTRD